MLQKLHQYVGFAHLVHYIPSLLVYLTMLSQLQTLNGIEYDTEEFEVCGRKVVVAYLRHCPEVLKNLSVQKAKI